jgi:hypothetical protein
MVEPDVDDKMKLKRLVAFSRDIILVSLDREVLPLLIEDTKIRNNFIEYSYDLTKRVKKDMQKTLSIIDRGKQQAKLEKEGLTGQELKFKYAFFNSIIDNVNSNLSNSPVYDKTPYSLPSLDTYKDIHIMTLDNESKRDEIKAVLISGDSLLGKFKRGGKKVIGKVVGVFLDGSNKYMDSVNAVIPYLGAVKEIKGFLEIGIDINDTVKTLKEKK